MTDFWANFQLPREEEEEELRGMAALRNRQFTPIQQEYQRNFFDRVFAPFEAPQQALFSMTRGVAADGFQLSDISTALSHGARYFNPFGNTERIRDDEIRQIFFGKQSDDERRTWQQSGTNFALSVLYDPLWMLPGVGPAIKAARLTGRQAEIAQKVAERVINPGGVIFDATKAAVNQGVRPGLRGIARRAGREDDYLKGTTWLSQYITNRFAGVPDEAREAMGKYEIAVANWQARGATALREVSKLNPDARRILAEAVESEAVYSQRILQQPLRAGQAREFERITTQLDAKGVDHDLFWQGYQAIQQVETGLAHELLSSGLLKQGEYAEMYGRHIRRMYQVFDNPKHGLERIDALLANPEMAGKYANDFRVFDAPRLRASLNAAANDFDTNFFANAPFAPDGSQANRLFAPEAGMGFNPSSGNAARYFPEREGRRRFDADTFIDDFGEFLHATPEGTLMEAVDYVRDVMFKGTKIPTQFMETIQNYLAKGTASVAGLNTWKAKLQNGGVFGTVEFRTHHEQLELLAQRQNIPEIIRREVLQEVEDAAPRFATDITKEANLLELRKMFDEMSGATRANADLITQAQRVAANEIQPADLTAIVANRTGLTGEALATATKRLLDGAEETSVLATRNSGLVSDVRTPELSVWLPNSEGLGSMANKYTTPGLALQLQQFANMGGADSNKAKQVMNFLTDAMARGTGQFKMLKIVMDGGANFRDFVGSFMQLDVAGVMPFNLHRMYTSLDVAKKFVKGEANQYTDMAHGIGYRLMDNGFSSTELEQIVKGRDHARLFQSPKDWLQDGTDLFSIFKGTVADVQTGFSNVYRLRENMFRTYVFSDTVDNLMHKAVKAGTEVTPELRQSIARQAAAKTDQALFNYADIPVMAEWARKYGVAPFITFPIKAGGQLVSALMERPHRVLSYEKGMRNWNEHHAGTPEDFAREVAALPEHKRRALVVRLPGTNKEGQPLFLDLSYFMPWYAIKDTLEDTGASFSQLWNSGQDAEDVAMADKLAGGGGQRGSVVSPLIFQLHNAFTNNQDGLGRPIYKETDTFETRMKRYGDFLYQFMAPPTWFGGTTADSVGRAMLAVARTSDNPVDWVERVAPALRSPFATNDDILDRYGRRPTSRALAGHEQIFGMGEQGTAIAGGLAGLALNVTASDPVRQAKRETVQRDLSVNQIQRQIAQVRANRNLSLQEKREEILRLQNLKLGVRQGTNQRLSAMR